MPRKTFAVILARDPQTDQRNSALSLKLYGHVPELMVDIIEENGFFVDVNATTSVLQIRAWQSDVDWHEIAIRLVEALIVWHGQYCGYSSIYSNSKLHILSNLPLIGNIASEPPALDAPLRCLGELRAQLERAVLVQDFGESARLKDAISRLSEAASQKPA